MRTVRLAISWALAMVSIGISSAAERIAGIDATDPTVDALAELRDVVRDLPSIHLEGYADHNVALIPRVGVLAAIGQAITDAER